jgi:hypothetical protein
MMELDDGTMETIEPAAGMVHNTLHAVVNRELRDIMIGYLTVTQWELQVTGPRFLDHYLTVNDTQDIDFVIYADMTYTRWAHNGYVVDYDLYGTRYAVDNASGTRLRPDMVCVTRVHRYQPHPVGHTHNDIDSVFGQVRREVRRREFERQ